MTPRERQGAQALIVAGVGIGFVLGLVGWVFAVLPIVGLLVIGLEWADRP